MLEISDKTSDGPGTPPVRPKPPPEDLLVVSKTTGRAPFRVGEARGAAGVADIDPEEHTMPVNRAALTGDDRDDGNVQRRQQIDGQGLIAQDAEDNKGNPVMIRFSRKNKEQYVMSENKEGKATGWTGHYRDGKWDIELPKPKKKAKKSTAAKIIKLPDQPVTPAEIRERHGGGAAPSQPSARRGPRRPADRGAEAPRVVETLPPSEGDQRGRKKVGKQDKKKGAFKRKSVVEGKALYAGGRGRVEQLLLCRGYRGRLGK